MQVALLVALLGAWPLAEALPSPAPRRSTGCPCASGPVHSSAAAGKGHTSLAYELDGRPASRITDAECDDVEGDDSHSHSRPRQLVLFRPPSRHTYGFVRGTEYDLPSIELRTLLASALALRERDAIRFIPVDGHSQPPSAEAPPRPVSKRQAKKKKLPTQTHHIPSLYWIECRDEILPGEIARAASRAILTHATFSIHDVVTCSATDWEGTMSSYGDGDDRCVDFLNGVDMIDMLNPNMSRDDRAQFINRVLCALEGNRGAQAMQALRPNREMHPSQHTEQGLESIILHNEKDGVHRLCFGYRTATGPAGTKGAPSQTLRRTHRGILKEYALKKRNVASVDDQIRDRSNTSTAMEPEIGFIMANLALGNADRGRARVLDPCCGSGRLLLYAAALGARELVGVDSDRGVYDGAQDEFQRHASVVDSGSPLATPVFFHGDAMDPSSTEALSAPDAYEAIVCDPPYNVGAPVLVGGKDARPMNRNRVDISRRTGGAVIESDGSRESTDAIDLVPHILDIARTCLVKGGRIVFFLPARGREQSKPLEELLQSRGWKREMGQHDDEVAEEAESLRLLTSRLQRFSPTFSRWLVCMEKQE